MTRIPNPNEISMQNVIENTRRHEIPRTPPRNHNQHTTHDTHLRSRSHSPENAHIHQEEDKALSVPQQHRSHQKRQYHPPKPPTIQDHYSQQHKTFDDSIPYLQPRHPGYIPPPTDQPIYHNPDYAHDYQSNSSQDNDPFELIMPPRSTESNNRTTIELFVILFSHEINGQKCKSWP
eukprot:GHVP01070328.1.p1 GENE.GHVP01070328.1~~GHVP01070328.1.p1  ORF type:complete len:177 (-),score=11.94 GHVP01070328.1:21-551(-)